MTGDSIRYLLNKLPKKMLVNTIVSSYETLFPDLEERKNAHHELALWIQAREVYIGNKTADGFSEPFKSEVLAKIAEWGKQHKDQTSGGSADK